MLNANFVRTKTFPVARDILPETSQQLLSDKSKQQQCFPILRFYLEVSRVKITKCKFKMLIYNRNFSLCNFIFWAKILGTYSYTLLLYPQTIWAPQVCLRPRPRNFIYLLEYLLNSKFSLVTYFQGNTKWRPTIIRNSRPEVFYQQFFL